MTIRDAQYPKGTTMQEIIAASGGLTVTAHECGVRPQTVIKWKIVPTAHVDTVVRLSGFPLWRVRPDIAEVRAKIVRTPRPARKTARKTA